MEPEIRESGETALGHVPLRGRGDRRILFELHGVEHPVHPTRPGRGFARYEDITHLATSRRGLWLGTRHTALLIPRSNFEGDMTPERVARELHARIAAGPGGIAQLARMAAVDETGQSSSPLFAIWGLAAVCAVVFLVHLLLGSDVQEVGYYSGPLAAAGDTWRIVTANFLHAFPKVPAHMLVNLLGAVLIGGIAERALGPARTIAVMGASGLLAMQACGWLDYPPVVGASGIVAGLLGSLTWLEFFRAEDLPAWWRLPRRPLVTVLLVSVVIDWLVPAFAGAAHIGGFVGGWLATWWLVGRPTGFRPAPVWIRTVSALMLAVVLLALGKAGAELAGHEDYAARNLALISELPGVTFEELNERAWLVAINEDSTEELLRAAQLAAERAALLSERSESAVLDTLAEVHFVLGENEQALIAIDEAIALAPGEVYYAEQRRRYTGERAPEDRPAPPMPWLPTLYPIPQWGSDETEVSPELVPSEG